MNRMKQKPRETECDRTSHLPIETISADNIIEKEKTVNMERKLKPKITCINDKL